MEEDGAEKGGPFNIKSRWDKFVQRIQEGRVKSQQAKEKGNHLQQEIETALTTNFDDVPKISTKAADEVLAAFYNQDTFQPTRKVIDDSVKEIVAALKRNNPGFEIIFSRYGRDPSVEDTDGEIDYFEAMLISAMVLDETDVQELERSTPIIGTPREKGKAMMEMLKNRVVQNISRIPEVKIGEANKINEAFMWPHPDSVNPDVNTRDKMVAETLERLESVRPGFSRIINAGAQNFDSEQIAHLATQVVAAFALSKHFNQ
jgi:hypothetical protein